MPASGLHCLEVTDAKPEPAPASPTGTARLSSTTPREERKFARVLVISAHPDDPEFGFGGTVAKLAAEGCEVRYVICSDGSAGGEDPTVPDAELSAQRYAEQRAAAAVLGVKEVIFLGFRDGALVADQALRMAITREIRRHRPDAVFTHHPIRNMAFPIGGSHPDHMAVGEATFASVYPDARNPRAFRELLSEGLEAHKVKEIWIGGGFEPEHAVDVTAYVDLKIKALHCHFSQFNKPGQEPWDLEKFLKERMAKVGEAAGFQYAEGFRRIETE